MTTTSTQPDNRTIRFAVRVKPQEYGDGAVFYKYHIIMRSGGKAVGSEEGPDRTHASAADARRAARERITVLKTHRLFIIPVTTKDIDHGAERSCNNCAIALALWHNQKRMGLGDEWGHNFRVEPYGFMANVMGIVLEEKSSPYTQLVSGVDGMPDLVGEGRRGIYVESMYEWAVHWDDWAESRHMTLKEWREEHRDDDCKPYKPSPCSFVLDLDSLRAEIEETAEAT